MNRSFAIFLFAIISIRFLTGCDPIEPKPENEEEIINKVTLTFVKTGGAIDERVFIAFDSDGNGSTPIIIDEIVLELNTLYTLDIKLENTMAGVNLTTEIENESEEHMFFFAWSDVYSNPIGTGNIGPGQRNQPINYNDTDSNGLPLGLSTTWTTAATSQNSGFRILLKHQPGIKSATSSSEEGESDLDLTFAIRIQ